MSGRGWRGGGQQRGRGQRGDDRDRYTSGEDSRSQGGRGRGFRDDRSAPRGEYHSQRGGGGGRDEYSYRGGGGGQQRGRGHDRQGQGYRDDRGAPRDDYRSQRGGGGRGRGDQGFRGGRDQGASGYRGGFEASKDSGKFLKSDQKSTPTRVEMVKKGSKMLCRPSYGTAGRPIKLVCNYFRLKYRDKVIYHYDLDINCIYQRKKVKEKQTEAELLAAGMSRLKVEMEKKVAKGICKKVFEIWVEGEGIRNFNPVYDGVKNVYTTDPLRYTKQATFTIDLTENGKTRKYQLTIQPVEKADGSNEINLSSFLRTENEAEVIMALNSIINYRESFSSQIHIGQSFFYFSQPNKVELGGLDIWFGHNQSVLSTEKGPVVQINLSAKVFHTAGSVIKYINNILRIDITQGNRPLERRDRETAEDSLKGVKVQVTHLSYPRRYTIEGITEYSANELNLTVDDGKKKTIAQYFESKYGRLKYPFLQCLHMRSNNNQTYIPFEHCVVIEGQPKMGKLDGNITATMIKRTAIPPADRFREIEGSYKDVIKESGKKMQEYNLSLDGEFMTVDGRVLKKPSLGYSQNGSVEPDHRGVWDMKGNKLYQSSIDIDSWILIDFGRCSGQDLDKFQQFFLSAAQKVGLNFGRFHGVQNSGNARAEQALKEAQRTKAAFAVIILSRQGRYNYDEIKFIANHKLHFVNQCLDKKQLFRFNDQIATNLCLKINAKLGGVNHVLDNKPQILTESTMVMGADAVHFMKGSSCPSIAAVVGSVDEHAFKYELACRVQKHPDEKQSQEIILDIRNMVKRLFKFYYDKNKKYPKKLIFFRDGVSEGQFMIVHDKEIPLIQQASIDVIGHIIPITFIVVQKRHQTRFKPQDPREGVGRPGNVPPGTTVDKDIVHPNRFEYFLNSHEGIQGTCKSARYIVLHDDSKFTPDELQQLSYHLCYTYNKCNRSVSIPAPVKYADLACDRAKKYADYHIDEEKRRTRQKFVTLPESAINDINAMGECGNSFFFL